MAKLNTMVKQKEQKPTLLEVPMDRVGKLANKHCDFLDTLKETQEELEHNGAELIEALRGSGRESIVVRGTVLSIKEIKATIKIAVKRPK